MLNKFKDNPADSFVILQLKDTSVKGFMSYDYIVGKNMPPKVGEYEPKYLGILNNEVENTGEILEQIYTDFNLYIPEDFRGHSLSVSDIVGLKRKGQLSYHYCDSFGFVDLTEFGKED